jgi:antitoxin VapB
VSARAKIFKHGRSQAVRLPKEFRFAGDEVRITKVGNRVILEPVDAPQAMPWGQIDALCEGLFMPDGREQPPMPPERDIFSS